MIIKESILRAMGAEVDTYNVSEIIFSEGDVPGYYYQIIDGEVKLNNYSEEGKEILQNILEKGQSIGESLLFMDKKYPVNAIATRLCSIIKLSKPKFFRLLEKYPDVWIDINKFISESLYFKQVMTMNLCSKSPASKLKILMDYLKNSHEVEEKFCYQIPLTRQQMANLTGLCVETTIRTLKTMEKKKILRIKNRKILY
ncbi:Crp/Fnr family transcriptional regulator [Epilithonimonas mollis]|uniref:cAMP-binding domain of CRP or a regulatory subunit of cAMP-dependent protein kinases n=1 Tax=Epilithonimonas mollis TaxID=216903 RepID=A0A1M6NQ79_9FLAO|nr:Crp/Fnr family transcriptional regulator [Epilithonimonas mollis]SHJ97873.1 cAMP-binding domain of CRP or a regulatory subunit of cAMP-dependent protein kinases [Epilithonimonas mollis]